MTICDDLRQSVLQAAIQGKLTKQLPEDGTAADLLASIKAEKEKLIKEKKIKKEKPLAPISEDEIPFDIPDNWEWVKLGELTSKIGAGNTPSGGKNSDVYVEYGIKFIRSMNVYNDGLHYNGIVYINQGLANGRANSAVYAKDILLNITGGSIGRCALVPDDFDLGNVNQHVLIIRNIDENNRAYIHLCICSPMVQSIIMDKAVGDKAGFSAEKAKNLLIPLPPLAEQHRIVARVDELMAKIDELEAVEKELVVLKKAFPGDMKAALLQAAMQGKLTQQLPEDGSAADLLASIKAEKEQLIKEKKIKKEKPLAPISADEIPFDIPDNWEWVKLASIVNFKIGKTPPRSEGIWWKDDIPWVSIADMPENGVLISTKEKISQQALDEKFSGKISPAGSLIMSFKLTVGRVSILGINAVHNEAIVSIFPYVNPNNALRDYLFKLLPFISQYGDSKNAIKGKTLNNDSISNLLIPLPPLAEQQRIVEKLDKLLPLCDALKEDGVA